MAEVPGQRERSGVPTGGDALEIENMMHFSDIGLTLKVLVATIDAQWEGMGNVGSAGMTWHYFPHARP